MKWFQRFGLKKKLFLMLVALVILPLIFLSMLMYSLSRGSLKKNMSDTLYAAAEGRMAELDYFYGTVGNVLTTMAGSTGILDYFAYQGSGKDSDMFVQSLSSLSSQLEYILTLYSNYVDSIAVVPYDRSYYQMVKRAPGSRYYDWRLFRRSDGEKEMIALPESSELGLEWCFFRDPEEGGTVGTVHIGIFDAGQGIFLGNLSCILNMDYFNQSVQSLASDGAIAILTEPGGEPIASSVEEERTEKFLETAMAETGRNGRDTVTVDGLRYLKVETVSSGMGWRMYLFAPYRSFLGALRAIPFLIAAAVLGYMLYSALLVRRIFHVIYQPIKRLSDEMSHFTYESISVWHEPRATDELKELEIGFNQMKKDIARLIENVKKEQEQKKEMEIRALQAQIMPHFLYNTLNSIKSLINTGRTREASEMLVAFISLLRISVDTTEECITLYEEISYLRHYILIMNVRYSQSIQLAVDVDERLLRYKLPKFILQPVVENSIIHGYEWGQKEVVPVIEVLVRQKKESIILTIADNGSGIPPEKLEELKRGIETEKKDRRFSRIGISNIAGRLRLLYGEEYGICVESEMGKGTRVTITIPKRQ